jgi:hypothetical protein
MKFIGVFLVFVFLQPCLTAQERTTPSAEARTIPFSIGQHTSRPPKLTLQNALKVAEKFIVTEKIDISRSWLYRANYMLSGDSSKPDTKKTPGWYFWWVNDSGALGDYVEVFVDMNGRCTRLGSM